MILNTDDKKFGGEGVTIKKTYTAKAEPMHGLDYSIDLKLPPLSALYLEKQTSKKSKGKTNC